MPTNPPWGALFSPCRRYRYRLWRQWDPARPYLLWILLNPSTADEITNDPTVERCMRRAVAWNFGGVQVCNIFAWRSTDPKALRLAPDPVGRPENDQAILAAAKGAGSVICGWGNHGSLHRRSEEVVDLLKLEGIKAGCLGVTRQWEPRHPLYVGYSQQVLVFVQPPP